MFRNRATVLTSNDPAAMPVKAVNLPAAPKIPQENAPQISSVVLPKVIESKPEVGGLVVQAPSVTPNSLPNSAGGNMEAVKPYEPPNLLNSLQQLFN
jgi:hypothetical protein